MTDNMNPFRHITMNARASVGTRAPLWTAQLLVGMQNPAFAPKPNDAFHAAAARVVAQDRIPGQITDSSPIAAAGYHAPRLMQAAVRARDRTSDTFFWKSSSLAISCGPPSPPTIVSTDLASDVSVQGFPAYSDVLLGLNSTIDFSPGPSNEIELPDVTLESGEIDTFLRIDSGKVAGWLGIVSGVTTSIFGAKSGMTIDTQLINGNKYIRVRLVPDGIEFPVTLATDPFAQIATTDLKQLRLLLSYNSELQSFTLRPVTTESNDAAARALRASFDAFMKAAGVDEGPLLADFSPIGLPFVWAVGAGTVNTPLSASAPQIYVDPTAIRARLLSERPVGSSIPTVCQLNVTRALVDAQGRSFTITTNNNPSTPAAGAVSTIFSWNNGQEAPSAIQFQTAGAPDGTVQGFIDTARYEKQQRERYTAAGLLNVDPEPTLYAFLPLERGMLQLPLSRPAPPTKAAPPALPNRSAFSGIVRGHSHISDDRDNAFVQVTAAVSAIIKIDVTARKTTATFVSARGTATGLLFAAASSPSPSSILPTLDAGPIACEPLDLVFGDPDMAASAGADAKIVKTVPCTLAVSCQLPTSAHPGQINLTITPDAVSTDPVIAWLAHPLMALVSTMPMTRTRFDATRPSTTRDLVPFEVIPATKSLQLVTLLGANLSPFPRLTVPATALSIDKSPRWPWPKAVDNGLTSPGEASDDLANVSVSCMTLPGVEMSLVPANMGDWSKIKASLRYDLPILGELFSSATLPKPPGGSTDQIEHAPTALELEALSEIWQRTGNRHALSRTINDRATDWTTVDGAPTAAPMAGLVEPYTFEGSFSVATQLGALPLGAYTLLGTAAGGRAALAGLTQTTLKSKQGRSFEVLGFSTRLYEDDDGKTFFDTRGVGQAITPRSEPLLPSGFVELRETGQLESRNDGSINRVNRVALTAAHVGFQFSNSTYGLRLRDLPMTADKSGNLIFAPTTLAKDGTTRILGGPEGAVGPTGSTFARSALSTSVYEWSFYDASSASIPSYVFRCGALSFRPLRLASVKFEKAPGGGAWQMSSFEIIANVEAPSETASPAPPIDGDDPYQMGNPVSLSFKLTSDGKPASLVAVHPVSIVDRTIRISSAQSATVSFSTVATLRYGDEPTLDVASFGDKATGTAQVHHDLPIVLQFDLAANQVSVPLTITGAKAFTTLFGRHMEVPFTGSLTNDALLLDSHLAAAPSATLQIARLALRWADEDTSPTLLLSARVLVSGLSTPPTDDTSCNLVDWRVGGTLRWFSTILSTIGAPAATGSASNISFDIDHGKGLVRLSLHCEELADDAKFVGNWPITGVPLTLSLALAFPVPETASPQPFPDQPSAGFVEATCGTPQALYIRHRTVAETVSPAEAARWDTRILVSLPDQKRTSAIAWPIDGLRATFPPSTFAADPRHSDEWSQTITVDDSNSSTHSINLAIRDAPLAADLLTDSMHKDVVEFAAPWVFSALAAHELAGQKNCTWTSISEIVIGPVSALRQEAKLTLTSPPGELAFIARNMLSVPDNLTKFTFKSAVFSRALVRAGIPTLEMLASIGTAGPPPGQTDLFIAGASLIEVAAKIGTAKGHSVVTPWIAPLFSGGSLGPLDKIPQAPWKGSVSTYDLASYAMHRLDPNAAIPFSTRDASVAGIDINRARLAKAGGLSRSVPAFEPVSQSVIEDVDLTNPPIGSPEWLCRPIWIGTIAAWKGILDNDAKDVGDRTVTVTPVRTGDRTTTLRLGLRRLSRQDASDDPPDGKDEAWSQTANFEVLVQTRNAVTSVPIASAEAKTLSGCEQPIGAGERSRLARLCFAVPDQPLAAAIGKITDLPEKLLAGQAKLHRTHKVNGFLELPAYLDSATMQHPLRSRERTVFASGALSWPRAAARADALDVDHPAALQLGNQRPLQDSTYSWAGDVRAFSVAGAAPGPARSFVSASVLTIGQRALFRRPSDEDAIAPPDRALIPVPPRARVPGAESIEQGLRPARLRKSGTLSGELEAGIAPIQPTQFEVVTTGRRPGVLFFQYDGLTFVNDKDNKQAFDSQEPRFGRPADRGPVVFRQTRAPRSTAYSDVSELSRRRQTFIGSYCLDQAGKLLPSALARGSMTALRSSGDDGKVETILLRLANTASRPFCISASWDGALNLTATLYGVEASKPKDVLAGIGFGSDQVRATLVIDGTTFPLTMALGAPAGATVPIALTANDAASARKLLQSAGADSVAYLSLSVPDPKQSTATGAQKSDLVPGAPRVLSMPVPIALSLQPSLHLETATLAFGDPAYDREISSKTLSDSLPSDTGRYLLAIDRVEYDLSSTLYFGAGLTLSVPGQDITWESSSGDATLQLQLGLLRKSAPASATSIPLAIAKSALAQSAVDPAASKTRPSYNVVPGTAYAIALSNLRLAAPNDIQSKDNVWDKGYQLQPADLQPGDRIVVTVTLPDNRSLNVATTLVREPVLPPPAAVYGLATLDNANKGEARMTSSLFATAPLPQVVEFQDLKGDLAKGLVRRRALFVWSFSPRTLPKADAPYGALTKFDRAGGGQLPDNKDGFQPLLL